MDQTAVLARFTSFCSRLREHLAARADVIGLVWIGSTAARDRVDEWSDHDFAVVTTDGAEERLREDLSWLPDPEWVAMAVREEHGGFKVVYDDGHVLESGVTSLAGPGRLARQRVRGGARPGRHRGGIRVGRCRRGEVLVANQLVRTVAVDHLLTAWRLVHPVADDGRLDDLDPFRRFEQVYPAAGRAIGVALAQEVKPAARALLSLAESRLNSHPEFPARAASAVRGRVGWR